MRLEVMEHTHLCISNITEQERCIKNTRVVRLEKQYNVKHSTDRTQVSTVYPNSPFLLFLDFLFL